MGRHSQSGNGRSRNQQQRPHTDQRGRRPSDRDDERSADYGNSTREYRGAAQRGLQEQNPPYSGQGHAETDDEHAFDTHAAGEDRDNYNATADHFRDQGLPLSYQGKGFFGCGQDAPYEHSEPHVGVGHSAGYGPEPNPPRGLGFRGRGPKGYQRSDERLLEEISERLTHDDDIDAHEVSVSVEKSEVTLSGTVNSREEKRRADDIAENVSGVLHVQNNLRVQK